MTSKKNRIRILVVGFIVFLTVSYVLAYTNEGQISHNEQGEQSPRIVSVTFINEPEKYKMVIIAEDEDSESIRIEVLHEGGEPDRLEFTNPSINISDVKSGTFTSQPFSLMPRSHLFIIIITDSEENQVKMQVIIDVPGNTTPISGENQPPRIVSVTFINEPEKYKMVIIAEDEDSESIRIEVLHEGGEPDRLEFTNPSINISDVKSGTFTSQPFSLMPRSHLFIIITDSEENQVKMQVIIDRPKITTQETRENQPPRIVFVGFSNVRNEYTITIEVEDRDSETVDVQIDGKPDAQDDESIPVSEKKTWQISKDSKKAIVTSESIALEPGSYTFTIIATDSEGNETSISSSIVVPQVVKNQILVILIPLLFTAIIVLSVFFLSRRPRKTTGLPDYREEVDLLLQEEPKYYETTEPRHYEMETAALKGQLADAKFQLEESQDKYGRLRENIQNIVGQTEIDDLNRIAKENSPERRDISTFIHYLLRAYQELGNLNMPYAKREIRNAIDNYDRFKTSFSGEEKDARSRAEYAYQNALQELKKAHGALDVKILELFLRKADELIRRQSLYGEKTQNYEASKKLSEAVQSLLEDPELRTRLRKLREAGYIDPVELG